MGSIYTKIKNMLRKNKCYKIYNRKFFDIRNLCYFLAENYKIFSSSSYNETVSLVINHSSRRDYIKKEEKFFLPFMEKKGFLLYSKKNICFAIGNLGFSVDMMT